MYSEPDLRIITQKARLRSGCLLSVSWPRLEKQQKQMEKSESLIRTADVQEFEALLFLYFEFKVITSR